MQQNYALHYEPRPRDFSARLPRRGARTVGMRKGRRHMGRRALVLLAAIAVPALAAPDQWGSFSIGSAGKAELQIEPMPFERSGDSFPGSAFYYLASETTESSGNALVETTGGAIANAIGGPIARSFRIDNSGVDRSRALDCLTAAVYYEAASEPDQGQRAVAQVVLNRVAHPSYPKTVCGVVYQGSERSTGCQFSFTCDGALSRRPSAFFWDRARRVAAAALSGAVEPSVGLATHYHTIAVHPYWAPSLNYLITVGAHRFYSFKGRAGDAGAFRFAYGGGEPSAAPHPHSNTAQTTGEDPALDPLALQRAYEAGLKSAQGTGETATPRAAAAPAYSQDVRERGGDALYRGDKLPGSDGVRPEYQQSGQWIAKPGG
ncbi:MAG TPA: cell wall hydrolase [Novosphingobium sp.]|nr:cell wall hydrolase [Novosphingobium sp.]